MTQEFLQDTMVADLKELFSHERLKNSLGVEREIQIYPPGCSDPPGGR